MRSAVNLSQLLGLKVVAHALSDRQALLAGLLSMDVLAHTPTERLSAEALLEWCVGGRAVIGTLEAFGGYATTVHNLEALRECGVSVMYGTDFGNVNTTGINAREIEFMVDAGLDGRGVLDSATSVPSKFWSFPDLGLIHVGFRANLLIYDENPLLNPRALATPTRVFLNGVEIGN